ncbi:MAG: hypothetical protein JEZ07_17040 [Phycisphaerae bacterium]|nr:hypothetical protein [Phycisphaerae bacterium]
MIFSTRDKIFDGAIWFAELELPSVSKFDQLKEQGCELSIDSTSSDCNWEMTIKHPDWGTGRLICPLKPAKADLEVIQHNALMTPQEMQNFRDDMISMAFSYEGDGSCILAQYKNALRMINAIICDDGVGCIDYNSYAIWTAENLALEVGHDAILDPQHLISYHIIRHDNQSVSLHSHGLTDLGLFDFEILNPDPELVGRDFSVLRAITLEIFQGNLKSDSPKFAIGDNLMRMVPVEDFNKYASMDDMYFRRFTNDDKHNSNRSVCCQMPGKLLGKLSKNIKIAKFLTRSVESHREVHVNDELTAIIANRSQASWSVLGQLADDFHEFNFNIHVKLIAQTPDGKEITHQPLWFLVDEFKDDHVDVTLHAKPDYITDISVGYSDIFKIDKVLEWRIETPLGYVTSYNDLPARFIMQQDEQFRKALRLIAKRQTGQIAATR